MKEITAILNRWQGDRFENEVSCEVCGKLGSVAVIPIGTGLLPKGCLRICNSCLTSATVAIYREIHKHIAQWKLPDKDK